MGAKKIHKFSAKKIKNAKKQMQKPQEKVKIDRIQKQILSDLSPKYTEMKTGARISRFGRPQTETKQDASSIPTEITKFIPKHSPKRLRAKDIEPEMDAQQVEESQPELPEIVTKITGEIIPQDNIEAPEDSIEKTIQEEPMNIEDVKIEETTELAEEEIETQASEAEVVPSDDNPVEEFEETNEDVKPNTLQDDALQVSVKETLENHPDDASDTSSGEKSKQDFSDSDSALGSTASCSDHKDEDYFPGQILWGSFSTTNWYPCMAYPFDEEGNIIKQESGKPKQIHVRYFNWKGYTAYLPVKNVFEFKNLDDFWDQIIARHIRKSKIKPFTKSCYKAMEEAIFFKKYAVDERVKIFNDVCNQLEQRSNRKSVEPQKAESEVEASTSRGVGRKSVDSAHESSVSPTPSSPNYEPTKKLDPIECYFLKMQQFNATKATETKKLTVSKAEVKEAIALAVEDGNRRKSIRTVKKRKYEDFEQDSIKSECGDPMSSQPSTSSASEPKAKRAKIVKEETLEERFVIKTEYLKYIFRNGKKKRACFECLQSTDEPTYRCTGNGAIKCSGWFHPKCSGKCELKHEEIRHQTGDSDEIIQTQAIKTFLTCKSCCANVKKCFVCANPVDVGDEAETQHCPNQECRLTFHKKCLQLWPQSKLSKGSNKRTNQCPQHTCHSCFYKDIHSSGTLLRCVKCPSAYHMQLSCVPAGSVVLSQTQLICPRHQTEKELTRNSKEKNSKPLNIDWCTLCSDSGNLVCCESCPNAFHADCINYEESDDNYICQECQEGRLPLYNTIVWARVGAYRWWPGLIMPNNFLPESVLKNQKHDREFCVRFFGSYDYFWFTCERILTYDGSNVSVKSGSSRLDSAFSVALDEAHEMALILSRGDPQASKAKPKPYTKLLQNRPIHPVKLKKPDEIAQDICSCKSTDPSPCGPDSDCINMHLNVECSKSSCPAEAKCKNQKLRNREYAELKIMKTPHRGFGAIAVKDIPQNTFVCEYVGELIDTAEFNTRMNAKMANKEKEFYFLTIEADLYVDAEPGGNLARFINHSCDPNCDTRKIAVDGNTRIGIFSNQHIKAGTELTFDYQMEFVGNKKTACFCDSENCSGLIGEKPKEPEKKTSQLKKKPKRKPSTIKIALPESKKRRTLDPFESLLEQMLNKIAKNSSGNGRSIESSPPSSSEAADTHAFDGTSTPSLDQVETSEPLKKEESSLTAVIVSFEEMPEDANIILPSFKHVTGDAPDVDEPQTEEAEANGAEAEANGAEAEADGAEEFEADGAEEFEADGAEEFEAVGAEEAEANGAEEAEANGAAAEANGAEAAEADGAEIPT